MKESKEDKHRSEDDFWSIENLLSAAGHTGHSKFSSGSLSPGDVPSFSRTAGSPSPFPSAQNRTAGTPSPFSSGQTVPGMGSVSRGTPAGELLASYSFSGGLLRSVKIRRWPSKYNFYEKFLAAAREIYPLKGEKCEFTPFFSFMPQYQQMNHAQLRFYLWWRENLREGRAIPCDYCYLLLFVYEVLNLPDLLPPETGVRQLAFLWASYREKFPRLDKYLGEWLPDYCLIHGVPCPRETLAPFLPKIFASTTLREFYVGEEAVPFAISDGEGEESGKDTTPFADIDFVDRFLTYASSYDYRNSKYFSMDKDRLFSRHIPGAMQRFLAKCSRDDPRFGAVLGENRQTAVRDSYTGAVCAYQWKRQIEVTYLPIAGGVKLLSPVVTDAVKYCENCIRSVMGIKQRFRATHLTGEMKALLDSYFRENLAGYGKDGGQSADAPPVYDAAYEPLSENFSISRAADIELASRRAVELLSIDEESGDEAEKTGPQDEKSGSKAEEADAHSPAEARADPSAEEAAASQEMPAEGDDARRALLRQALEVLLSGSGDDFRALAETRGMFPEMLAETVNNAALARIGDILCETRDGEFRLLEDYREETAEWLREI